jgi:3-deoxy-D-manno-octulosonic-acid transferase
LAASEFSVARRSAPAANEDTVADIILLDSIGELSAVFPLAEIAFIGGSIAAHGGHNVIEPAAYGVCTITGPHSSNFAAITKALLAEGALLQLSDKPHAATELAESVKELLSDEKRRAQIGERARAVCDANRGATGRTLELLAPILDTRSTTVYEPPPSTVQTAIAK